MEKDGQVLISDRKYATAVILAGIFGTIGIHHFYVDRWAMGVFDLTLFLATIIAFWYGYTIVAIVLLSVDVLHTIIVTYKLLVGEYKDGDGRLITYPGQKI